MYFSLSVMVAQETLRSKIHIQRDYKDSVGSFVSLYTGAGGMDIGFYMAGFEPIWANDIDKYAVKTYNSLFEGHVATLGNIRDVNLPNVRPDLVIGGPPCQGFSVAGKMDPNDPRSKHVWDFLGIVSLLKPKAFVMENVKSLAENKRWIPLINELQQKARGLGYNTKLFLLNASHFGVPQIRERMFLIGINGDQIFDPIPTTKNNPPTVRQAFENIPKYGIEGNNTKCIAKITTAKMPVLRKSPYAGMLFNGQGRPLNLDAPALTLPASMGGNRTPVIDQLSLENKDVPWIHEYHTHLISGGKPWESASSRLRRITVEEAATIQTFPKGMHFEGTPGAQFRQIGNAVPPRLAYHVAVAVRKSLAIL